MHDPHHELPIRQQEMTTDLNSAASCRSGHSPVGGAPEPDPAPRVAGPVRSQGAPDGVAATEGGPQPGKAHRKSRTKSKGKGKARPRDKKQRPAQSVRLNDQEHALIQAGADAVGMSLAGFLAHSALAAARDQSRTAAIIATERDVLTELFGARRHLGWAGSNLNQVAKAINSGGDGPHLHEAIADIRRAAQAVKAAANRITNPQAGESA